MGNAQAVPQVSSDTIDLPTDNSMPGVYIGTAGGSLERWDVGTGNSKIKVMWSYGANNFYPIEVESGSRITLRRLADRATSTYVEKPIDVRKQVRKQALGALGFGLAFAAIALGGLSVSQRRFDFAVLCAVGVVVAFVQVRTLC